MCCSSCCGGGRDCCAPIIPPNEKAYSWRTGLWIIFSLHCVVTILKMVYMGIFSGLTDIFALVILSIALVRFDYCQIMIYIVCNLFEVFTLIVVLGYYLQTDMGKNVPKKKGEEEKPSEDKDQDESTGGGKKKKHGLVGTDSVHVMFRDIFTTFLEWKYDFYKPQDIEINSDTDTDNEAVELQASDDKEDDKTKFSKKHGARFIIVFCCGLILFYIVVSVIAHCAYREFKGIAEDCAGGSINLTDGNILYYGIITKREKDAIDEKKENQARARAR